MSDRRLLASALPPQRADGSRDASPDGSAPAAGTAEPGAAAVLAVIPAYNEAGRIGPVVGRLVADGLPVLVVDDGSRDATAAAAAAAGARVIRQANGGKGAAIRAGARWAIDHGYAATLFLDGDGQHDPAEAGRLIAAAGRLARHGRSRVMVIGRRSIGIARQPTYRRCFNRLSSLVVTWFAGRRIIDSQSGYRLVDPALLLALPCRGCRYDLETEACILAARAGIAVVEVPITVIYNDKVSGVHPVYDTLRFFRATVSGLMASRPWLRRARGGPGVGAPPPSHRRSAPPPSAAVPHPQPASASP